MKKVITLLVVLALAAGVWMLAAKWGAKAAKNSVTTNKSVAQDAAVEVNMVSLQQGIQSYTAVSGSVPTAVTQATLGSYVNPWPTNPFTQEPMKPGNDKGDYTYTRLGETQFTIAGHLSSGRDVVRQ